MKEIKLTQGKVAMVDDEDYEYLNQFKWCCHKIGNNYYAARYNKEEYIFMHRFIMKIDKGSYIDHQNHDGLDNCKINLRKCTNLQNAWNARPYGKSKYKGVCYSRNRPIAQISINGRRKFIGSYNTEEEAAKAYDEVAKKYHGEFANLNFK